MSGAFLLLLGVLVLAGWYARIPILTHVIPGWASMKANTASCFLLSGWVLLRASYRHGKVHTDRLSTFLLAVVALVGVISLLEYGLGRSFGLDELLIHDAESRLQGQPPGRMSPATALSFLSLSAGLWLVDYSLLSCLFCMAGMAVSLLALVGFLYRTEALYMVRPFATVALHTAIGFVVLGLGTLTVRPRHGILPLLRSSYADVARTRPLLLGALVLPPGFGVLCLEGQRRGWYPPEFTLGLVTVLLMLASCVLLWWTSRTGARVDHRRRAAEQELQSRTEQLTSSNAALEQYAFAAAHDLQEPLRMISIYSQKLSRAFQEQLRPDEHGYLKILQSSAQRMSQLVADLLLHSRILAESDKVFTAVDTNEVLRDAISRLSVRIAETGAEVTLEKLPPVIGDFGHLVQLFQNVLDDSLKYRNSDIVPHVRISAREDGTYCVFSVTDNGIGFEMKYARQIFGVFKRLQGREIPGTGMGLAICHRVAEQQGGRIWAESQPGVGSTFHIALVRAPKPAQTELPVAERLGSTQA